MKNFNRGGGFGDRSRGSGERRGGGFGQRKDFGRGASSFGRPGMHKATCADCGATCEVPFRPTGDKPVYCSDCFKGKDGAGAKRSFVKSFNQPRFEDKKSDNFRSSGSQSNDQIAMLSAKLDQIIESLAKINLNAKSAPIVKETKKEKVTEKQASKKNISKKPASKPAAKKRTKK